MWHMRLQLGQALLFAIGPSSSNGCSCSLRREQLAYVHPLQRPFQPGANVQLLRLNKYGLLHQSLSSDPTPCRCKLRVSQ